MCWTGQEKREHYSYMLLTAFCCGDVKVQPRKLMGLELFGRPHTLPPTRLYLAHLAPYLTEAETELHAELKQTQAENESLAQGLQAQREEAERLVAGLETIVRDLEAANEAMDGIVEGEDLRRDLGEAEEELRALGREREMKL